MTADRTADLASIRRFVQVVENVHWQRNADAFLAMLTRDAVLTDPAGRQLVGLDAITPFARQSWAALPDDEFATYAIEHVQFLGDDVAAVNVRARPVRADGVPIAGEPEGAKLYVLVRQKGEWWLAVGHGTFVQAAEPA